MVSEPVYIEIEKEVEVPKEIVIEKEIQVERIVEVEVERIKEVVV